MLTDQSAQMRRSGFPCAAVEIRDCLMRVRSCIAVVLCVALPSLGRAEQPTSAQLDFFEKQVRPVLVQRCQECHSAETAESDFQADSRLWRSISTSLPYRNGLPSIFWAAD